jgi:hypothetical protein
MILKELLEILVEDEVEKTLEPFDITHLDDPRLKPAEKVDYAHRTLPYIDKGSSRAVFALSDKEVLKVARNRAGIAQNEAEHKLSTDQRAKGFVADVYAFGKGFGWLKSERVNPLTSFEEFKGLSGISFKTYVDMIDAWLSSPDSTESQFLNGGIAKFERLLKTNTRILKDPKLFLQTKQQLESYKLAWKSPFLRAMMRLVDRELKVGDVASIEKSSKGSSTTLKHYGQTWDNRIVLLDYGFTKEVANVYYGDEGRIATPEEEAPEQQTTDNPLFV